MYFDLGKTMIITGLVLAVVGVGFGVWSEVTAAEPSVIANIGQALDENTLAILGEKTFETIDECWAYVNEFNIEGNAQGFIAFCWPTYMNITEVPTEGLVQS